MTYSLEHLLNVQSPTIKKLPGFRKIEGLLFASPKLLRVRLNKRAYRLLNEPRLKICFLTNFYATYRVPKSEFFSLFLSLKWAQVQKKADNRLARAAYIDSHVAAFPRDFLSFFTVLCSFDSALYPRTKKRVNEMSAFTLEQWLEWFSGSLAELMKKHQVLQKIGVETLLACMLLECLPDFRTGKVPPTGVIKQQFRILSKKYHPDSGGDTRRFLLVKKAYEELRGS